MQRPDELKINYCDPITMTMLMTPDMANFSGKVHGGALLKILDQVAYACASHYSGNYVVTLSVDQVYFKAPVQVGELVTFYSSINHVGNSTMEVGVKVIAENIHSGERRHTISCFFTMVAVDAEGNAAAVPEIKLTTDKDKQRYIAASMRKQLRKEYRDRVEEIHDKWTENKVNLSSEEMDAWIKEHAEL